MGLTKKQILDEVSNLNPQVSSALRELRSRATAELAPPKERQIRLEQDDQVLERWSLPASSPVLYHRMMYAPVMYRRRVVGWVISAALLLLFSLGLFYLGSKAVHWVRQNPAVLISAGSAAGGLLVGGLIILVANWVGKYPVRRIPSPVTESEEPLSELQTLAARSAERLRRVHRLQLVMAAVVFALLMGLVVWSVVMVCIGRLNYAVALGSTSVGGLALAAWKWQPFDRASHSLKAAGVYDALSVGLRQRLESIAQIKSARERAKAQWEAVVEYADQLQRLG